MSAAERKTETIPEWKREEIDELVAFLERYDSVGVVGVAGIPSRQLQSMRADLHGQAAVRMGRNTLMRRALEDVDEGVEELTEFVSGQVAFIGTNDNPFSLYQRLEESKTPAPIGAGEVAPNDIVIPEGDTGVDPGPFVGELQNVGAAARIMEGSIHVTEDSVVCEAGEEVSADLANVLGELGIEPKEVGLDLRGVYSEGVLFEPEALDIDVDAYRDDVATAAARARSLAVEAGFPTAATMPTTLAKAAGEAKALAVHAAIEDPDVMPDLVSKADAQLRALAARIDDEEALPEELRDVAEPAVESEPAESESDSETDDSDEDEETEASEADDEDEDDSDEDVGAGLDSMF